MLDTNGAVVVKYTYDAWGKCQTTVVDSSVVEIANLNPFRYRSYYYDTERNLYFLMKRKRINTIPNGTVVVWILVFEILLTSIMGISLLPAVEAIGLFAFSLFFILSLLHYIKNKHWNFIEETESGICHGKENYSWESVCITVMYRRPNFLRNAYEYYVYFDDHYLSKDEIDSKLVKDKGFYIILTPNRMKWLTRRYHKEIKIVEECPYNISKEITEQIRLHNQNL